MNKQKIKCRNILEGGRKKDFSIQEVHPSFRKQMDIVVTVSKQSPTWRDIIKSREEKEGQ